MDELFIKFLRCPQTGKELFLEQAEYCHQRVKSGLLVSADRANKYPIRNYIPRFVQDANYADNFGWQWNKFRQTQLDSYSGQTISANRFWKATGWNPDDISGKWILDVGCGAGRFAEVALKAGAQVVAIDYSNAVDACYDNLKNFPNLHVVQGDIYCLPFPNRIFSCIYSLGVLQHTPNVEKAFAALPPKVAEGGKICVDFYEKSWKSSLLPKYWFRPITKRMDKAKLFSMLETYVPYMLTSSRFLSRVPLLGNWLKRIIPVANYYDVLPLTERQHQEWALLDTFDWLSPEYDNPQTPKTIKRWLEERGLSEIEILKAGHLVGRGTVPYASGN